MAADQKDSVPQELKKSKQSKEMAQQKAADDLANEVKKGEAFLCAIGYISFLCILPLVLLKDSKFAQYHGKQALVLAIVIYFFDIAQILPPLFASIYAALKTLVIIYAIYKTWHGKYFKIPIIYGLSERFSIDIQSNK